ncbi:MAG: ice-binding family protein, partial [Candidatus Planktophila sp.]
GAASKVNLLNGAQACNIFWQVGTTSTLGAASDFKGNLLSKGAFVSSAGSTVTGRVLVTQGSASLNATQIIKPSCKVVKPAPTNNFGTGGGSYTSQYGKASYNFLIRGTESGTGIFTNITGKASWSISRAWNFSGTPTAYTYVNGVGNITGTGTLQYYANPKKDHDKRWLNAATGPVAFTIKYTRVTNGDGSLGRVSTFAIGFTGTPVAGVPSLPALGALVMVKGGDDKSDD